MSRASEIIHANACQRVGDKLITAIQAFDLTPCEFAALVHQFAPVDGSGRTDMFRAFLNLDCFRVASFRLPARHAHLDPALYARIDDGRMFFALGEQVTRVIMTPRALKTAVNTFKYLGCFDEDAHLELACFNALRLSDLRDIQKWHERIMSLKLTSAVSEAA